MGKLIISTNLTLDGVVRDPDGKEGFEQGGWFTGSEAWAEHMAAEAANTAALLLGARSDAWFAERWLDREGAWAERLHPLPKYVVSSSAPRWSNATRIGLEDVAEVKRAVEGDLVIYASFELTRAVSDLVDELRLFVFPSRATPAPQLLSAQVIGELPLLTYRSGR
jgi:hypothetical protein